jgi:hypothetical protein
MHEPCQVFAAQKALRNQQMDANRWQNENFAAAFAIKPLLLCSFLWQRRHMWSLTTDYSVSWIELWARQRY